MIDKQPTHLAEATRRLEKLVKYDGESIHADSDRDWIAVIAHALVSIGHSLDTIAADLTHK